MLTVSVQKDIGEYEEKVVLGLTVKRLVIIVIAIGLAIAEAIVGIFVLGIPIENIAIPIFLTAAVGFLFGYVEPIGMPFTDALPYLIRQNLRSTQLVYTSAGEMAMSEFEKNQKESKDKGKVDNVRKKQEKEYLRTRDYRGERSPELLIPRYYEAQREVEAEFGID